MKIIGIDRIVVGTWDVDATTERFSELLGLKFGERISSEGIADFEDMESRISVGPERLDIVGPASEDCEDPFVEHLERSGPGIVGLALRVKDLEEALEELADHDITPETTAQNGEFFEYYFHPGDFNGIYLGLSEFPHPVETHLKLENSPGEE